MAPYEENVVQSTGKLAENILFGAGGSVYLSVDRCALQAVLKNYAAVQSVHVSIGPIKGNPSRPYVDVYGDDICRRSVDDRRYGAGLRWLLNTAVMNGVTRKTFGSSSR